MRRNATFLLTISIIVTTGGCSLFQKDPIAMQPNLGAADMYAVQSESPTYPADPYNTLELANETQPTTSLVGTPTMAYGTQPAMNAGSSNTRFHVVSKHDTLFGIARMYYGDQRRWKEIYSANRNNILDPNMIRVGQRLMIP